MIDPLVTILSTMVVGQVCLAVPLLLFRSKHNSICLPLALFLLANGVLAIESIIRTLLPDAYQLYTALALPMLFLLCPSLLLYVEGLTTNNSWKMTPSHIRHYLLLVPCLILSAMILMLPKALHTDLFIKDVSTDDPFAISVAIGIVLLLVFWLLQCLYTIYKVTRRLMDHRKQLKDLFSNHEGKQLTWVNWMLLFALSSWLFSLLTVFTSNLFDDFLFSLRAESVLSLLLIWSAAHFGLQQKPVIIRELASNDDMCVAIEQDTVHTEGYPNEHSKYQRSALSSTQAKSIAHKLHNAMQNDKLYLDPNLSLHTLAKQIVISPNYISQTLNQTLSTNFFDYINHWRIEAAKPKVLADEHSILHIVFEVGFNARSSFYKAFKKETGLTPTEFRKQQPQALTTSKFTQ